MTSTLRAVGAAALLTITLAATARVGAADLFTIQQPLTYTLSATGTDQFQILVSAGQPVLAPFAAIVHVRSPLGHLLPASAVTLESPAGTIDAQGQYLTLTVADPSRFTNAGDYSVAIRLGGTVGKQKEKQTQVVSVTLQLPPAALNTDRLQNATLRAWRGGPWTLAAVTQPLVLEETGGRSSVRDLQVSAQSVVAKGTTEPSGAAAIGASGQPRASQVSNLTLGARKAIQLDFQVSGLDRAGTHTTALLISSPSLSAPVTVPLTIEVSDTWPFPAAVIALGVIGGAVLRYVSQARPRGQLRLRTELAAGDLARWREQTRDLDLVLKLDEIQELLAASRQQLQQNNTTAATAALDKADAELDKFAKLWRDRFTAAATKYGDTTTSLEAVALRVPDDEREDIARVAKARESLHAAQDAMRRFDLADAQAQMAAVAALVQELESEYPQAQRHLSAERRSTAAIEIVEAEVDRIAGRQLSLRIVDPAQPGLANAVVRWNFGDGTSEETSTWRTVHRYDSPGPYRVVAAIVEGGAVAQSVPLSITIEPRPIDRVALEMADRQKRREVIWTVGSLVLAAVVGLLVLYPGKSFGTMPHYIEAFLWGFGIDSGVKSVADLLKKV